jgi:hypothetical protein
VKSFAAGVAETLSMEVSASPATPSPAAPLSSQDANIRSVVAARHPLLIAFTRKPAHAMSSSRAETARACLFRFAMDGDVRPQNVSNNPQKSFERQADIVVWFL